MAGFFWSGLEPGQVAWSYQDPNSWKESYQQCQDTPTSKQSPINIVTKLVEFHEFPRFMLTNYDSVNNVSMEIVNNGHTVKIVCSGVPIEISGGGLPGSFKLENIHFHWGSSSQDGSEHQIDSQAYPMEMHIVNYNTIYPDVTSACCQPNGLAIFSVLFEVTSKPNPAYNEIVSKLGEVIMPESRKGILAVPVRSLLPSNLTEFYRYDGSLTTPGCNEVVTWTVFRARVQISEQQISCFRTLKSADINAETNENLPLVNNRRPLQNLNDRVVYASFRADKKRSALLRCACLKSSD